MSWTKSWDDGISVEMDLTAYDFTLYGTIDELARVNSDCLADTIEKANEIFALEEENCRLVELETKIDGLISGLTDVIEYVSEAKINLKESYKGSGDSTKLRSRLRDCESSISEVEKFLETTYDIVKTKVKNNQNSINVKYGNYNTLYNNII